MATQYPFNVQGVMGSDGHAPQYDPNGLWRRWNIAVIYIGGPGLNMYVPKVDDYLEDLELRKVFRVTRIDPLTLIPEWEDITDDGQSQPDYTAGGPETFRVYLDTDVIPYALMVDSRYKPGGSALAYSKIFRGSDTSNTGKVISIIYGSSGQVLTNQIPMELASIDNHTNTAIKVVGACHTNELMPQGERVTVVSYNAQGGVVASQDMLVVLSAFMRDVGASTKYITHISLESPFLSPSDAHDIEYPLNVPLQTFNMIGVVHYNDGSELKLPVDGSRFRMLGLEKFVATTPGQRFPLGLSYRLGNQEQAIVGVSADGKFVTQGYWLVATPQNGAYSVKIYGYPVWVDNSTGYVMKWFMLDLNRDIMFDVSPYIRHNAGSVFNGTAYNIDQALSIRLVLREVSGAFNEYIHTQTMQVLLKAPGTDPGTNWLVGFDPGQNPYYGSGLFARVHMVNQNLWRINLGNALGTQTNWLEKLYGDVKPLMDRRKETAPPAPTHFVLMIGNQRQEHPVSAWADELTSAAAVPQTGTLFIEFIRRTSTGDLRLAVTGLAIKSV